MEYYEGTYSFFRYPNEKLIGFSPFLGYLNVESGFLRKAFDMKRTSKPGVYLEHLVDEIFYQVQGNLTATISPRKPIYIIAKAELLNEFIVHVIINNIEGFEKRYGSKIIETHVSEYTEFLKCECNKKETESECSGSCIWSERDDKCNLKETTTEIINNKRKFTKNLREFFELVNKCIENTINPDENNIFTPYYLLGLTLMSYWYLIKNTVHSVHSVHRDIILNEKKYFDDYMRIIKMYIESHNKLFPNLTKDEINEINEINEIDDYISKNNLIELPKSLLMIHANIDDKEYPACFETVVNEFFNLLFYDDVGGGIFIPDVEGYNLLQPLIDHYESINISNSDYTSHYIINEFVKLTTNIPDIEYNDNGYNIVSSYENFLNILNYFLNTDHDDLEELLENISIIVNDFNEESGKMDLDIKGKNIILNIKPGHSFSKREMENKNINFKNMIDKDKIFNIFLNYLSPDIENEIGVDMSFIEFYNMINKNNLSLPFYEYIINTEKNIPYYNNYVCKILTFNSLKYIPKWISFPESLDTLDISRCDLGSLPVGIPFPKKLKSLHLNNNNLNSLSEDITFPEDLMFLNLSDNNLNSIPKSISLLKNLKYLYLHNNKFKSLPIDFSFLKKLIILDLSYNEIKIIPKGIIFPENLEILNLEINKIELLIDGTSFPKNLKTLNLSSNDLESLPDKISFPNKLQKLDFDHNKLKSLPDNISFPESLQKLGLSNNNLNSLPDNISFPKNLMIFLGGNNFTSLPKNINISKNNKIIF